jgi:MFS family permease
MTNHSFWGEIKRNQLLLALYLPTFLISFCQGLLDPILPLFAKGLEINYAYVGLVVAGYSLGMLLGDIPSGFLLKNLGRKRSMLLGFALSALTTMLLFWTEYVPMVVLLRVISGFAIALFSIARHAYVADRVSVANRGRVIALLGGVFRLGSFAGPAIGGMVAASYSLRVPFLVYGFVLTAGFIVVLVFVRRIESGDRADEQTGSSKKAHFLDILKTNARSFTFAGAAQLLAQMIRRGRGTIIPLYGADVLGLDVETIGFIVSIAAAIDMSLFLPTGWIMDRLGRKAAVVPAFAIMGLGMVAVTLAGDTTGLIVAAVLMGIGNGLSSGSMMTIGADLAPKEGRGEFLGVWRFIGDIGASGGPLVVGNVAELFSLPMAALTMAAAGALASGTFFFLVPETLKKQLKTENSD